MTSTKNKILFIFLIILNTSTSRAGIFPETKKDRKPKIAEQIAPLFVAAYRFANFVQISYDVYKENQLAYPKNDAVDLVAEATKRYVKFLENEKE